MGKSSSLSSRNGLSILRASGPSLGALLVETAARHGSRLALSVDGMTVSYTELLERAARLAGVLADAPASEPSLGAVFADRTLISYLGVLGTLLAGAGYVPLNARFPDARNSTMLLASGARWLVIGAKSAGRLDALLAPLPAPITVVVPDLADPSMLAARHAPHVILGAKSLADVTPRMTKPSVDPHAIAYLMFTSGSTGTPRGVMVTHANALYHLEAMWNRYSVIPEDRFSQAFDLTFDLSVFDMFMSWGRGASLHSIPADDMMAPADFIQRTRLTFWFSVPSAAIVLKRLRLLSPGAFPSLRYSLFCGEKLPSALAEAWQAAAPHSIVENLYGPTEVTIACTLYRWDPARSPSESLGGVVPIGGPFPGLTAAIVDERLARVACGEKGELAVRGPQVTPGYWKDPVRTAERFVAMPWDAGPENRWYRTGDIAFVDEAGNLIFCGRADDQVKIRGFRVELGEIENALRVAAKTDQVAVIPDLDAAETTTGVVAFVADVREAAIRGIMAEVKRQVPSFMVPREIIVIAEMPLNANGKIDRHQLKRIAAERNQGNRG